MEIDDDARAAGFGLAEDGLEAAELGGVERAAGLGLQPFPADRQADELDAAGGVEIEVRAAGVDVILAVDGAGAEFGAGQVDADHGCRLPLGRLQQQRRAGRIGVGKW